MLKRPSAHALAPAAVPVRWGWFHGGPGGGSGNILDDVPGLAVKGAAYFVYDSKGYCFVCRYF